MARRGDSLGKSLYTWAIEEMHYQGHDTAPLSPVDMQMICCGALVDIWKYVTANVSSAQTVKKVRGNLALTQHKALPQSGQKSTERTNLEEQRSLLQAELTNIQTDISHVEKDLTRIEKSVAKTDCLWRESSEAYHDTNKKTALLETYSQLCGEEIAQNEELANRLHSKLQLHIHKNRRDGHKEGYVSRETRKAHCLSDIETKSSQEVREACDLIKQLILEMVGPAADKTTIHEKKEHIWTRVEHIITSYSTDEVVASLITNTDDSTVLLADKTAKISIAADADRLRFQYEGGGSLKDLSNPPTVLQSVRQLLQESQAVHVKKFFETERNENLAYKLEEKIVACKEKLDKAVMLIKQPGERDLARTLVTQSITLAGEAAALGVIKDETSRIQGSVRSSFQAQESLLRKHQRITDFRQLADQKQNLIHVLARHNSRSPARLDSHKLEIEKYIAGTLLSHDTKTDTLISQHSHHIGQEVDLFGQLKMPYLLHTYIDGSKLTTVDLSIHHNDRPDKSTAGVTLGKVSQLLDVPYYKGTECLPTACVTLKHDIRNTKLRADYNRSKMAAILRDTDRCSTEQQISDLCTQACQHDDSQLSEILPLINGRINKTTNSIGNCLNVTQLVKHWWEQPGQYSVPWVKVKGQTLSQWLNQWTVLSTQTRQAQVGHTPRSLASSASCSVGSTPR